MIQKEEQANDWFSSDPHYHHSKIIQYCNRPYASKQEMNEALIANWNAVVKPQDNAYCLGDFVFGDERDAIKIVNRLNGNKRWIRGNHDSKLWRSKELRSLFSWTGDYLELKIADPDADRGIQMICLFHYPMIVWNKSHRGSWHLHGHCHNKLKYPFEARILDVGVDGHGYRPISYQEVKAIMRKKKFTAVDHHVEL